MQTGPVRSGKNAVMRQLGCFRVYIPKKTEYKKASLLYVYPHIRFIAAMTAGRNAFYLMDTVFSFPGLCFLFFFQFKVFPAAGNIHFGFVSAVFTSANLFYAFGFFTHIQLPLFAVVKNKRLLTIKQNSCQKALDASHDNVSSGL
jgi:hypothetical protein